jgi:hypothetical protein
MVPTLSVPSVSASTAYGRLVTSHLFYLEVKHLLCAPNVLVLIGPLDRKREFGFPGNDVSTVLVYKMIFHFFALTESPLLPRFASIAPRSPDQDRSSFEDTRTVRFQDLNHVTRILSSFHASYSQNIGPHCATRTSNTRASPCSGLNSLGLPNTIIVAIT